MRGKRASLMQRFNLRNPRGAQLIEATCTSVMVALMTACMFDTINAQGRLVTEGKYQIFATTVAQTAIESARSLPYSVLEAQVGQHPLQIQLTSADTVMPRPVWQDRVAVRYNDPTTITNFYRDHATAVEQIDIVNPNMVRITVNVSWGEHGHTRSLRLSTLVSRWGTHG
jgi:hypothetical protein